MNPTPSHHDQMRDFDDFADVLTGDGLDLPIRGTVYTVEPCDADTGLYLTRLFGQMEKASRGLPVEVDDLDDDAEVALFERVLGDAYGQMIDDGAPWPAMKLAMAAGWTYHVHGAEAARMVWNAGGDPKALDQAKLANGNRKARRAGQARERTQTPTGAVATTNGPGSGSGTNSHQPSGPNQNGGGRGGRRRRRR